MWIYLVLLFGIIKGLRDGIKKKALEKNSVIEVLFFYTLLGFICVIPTVNGIKIENPIFYFYIFVKAFVVFVSWILAFYAINKIPVSLYGVVDLARIVFATLCGVLFLHETMTINQIIGFILVIAGILLVNRKKGMQGEEVRTKYIFMTIASSILAATSGVMDKILMKTLTSSELQFWYMLFMLIMYAAYIIVTKTKISIKTLKTNYWIVILSVIFIIGDKALFIANADPDSKVTVMTILKQSSVFFSILMGKLMFNEKNLLFRLLCSCIVVAGIIIAVL